MSTLLLSRADVGRAITPADCLVTVEKAFSLAKAGLAHAPEPVHIRGIDGAFHAKGAALTSERTLAAVKVNGNFPGNPVRGRPTIQGVIVLCDAENGDVLAVMDSIEITLRRTAAASALAARYLARPGAATLAVIGCGAQARPQAEALAQVLPLAAVLAWDLDPAKTGAFASEMSEALAIPVTASRTLRAATGDADVIVTCTTSRTPFLTPDDVAPGTFIAAVGADNPDKCEISPSLMAIARVVTDVREQCLTMGDLHHAVSAGAMTAEQVYADLGDIVSGAVTGRSEAGQIIVFDSTGTAIQDVACAAAIYERAHQNAIGARFAFS